MQQLSRMDPTKVKKICWKKKRTKNIIARKKTKKICWRKKKTQRKFVRRKNEERLTRLVVPSGSISAKLRLPKFLRIKHGKRKENSLKEKKNKKNYCKKKKKQRKFVGEKKTQKIFKKKKKIKKGSQDPWCHTLRSQRHYGVPKFLRIKLLERNVFLAWWTQRKQRKFVGEKKIGKFVWRKKKKKQRKAHKIGGVIPFDLSDTTASQNFS